MIPTFYSFIYPLLFFLGPYYKQHNFRELSVA